MDEHCMRMTIENTTRWCDWNVWWCLYNDGGLVIVNYGLYALLVSGTLVQKIVLTYELTQILGWMPKYLCKLFMSLTGEKFEQKRWCSICAKSTQTKMYKKLHVTSTNNVPSNTMNNLFLIFIPVLYMPLGIGTHHVVFPRRMCNLKRKSQYI
jgi:hypothetical protein